MKMEDIKEIIVGFFVAFWIIIGRPAASLLVIFGLLGIAHQGLFLTLQWFTGRAIQFGMEVSLYRLGVAVGFAMVGFLVLLWTAKWLDRLDPRSRTGRPSISN